MHFKINATLGRAMAIVMVTYGNPASADVTIQQQTTIHAFVLKAHSTTTDRFTADKKRSETQFSCDGMLSMICGHKKDIEIVRLDRDVTWNMEPKQKRYAEHPLPTAEQMRAVIARQQAAVEKLKSCPQTQAAQSAVDTSKCEMSPPVFAVEKTQDAASIIGHAAQRTSVSLTQICKIKESDSVCKMSYSLDLWLTQDELPGMADRTTFDHSYLSKLGLTASAHPDMSQLSPMLAPYADSLKQLSAKSADFKGYPLKSTFRFNLGGEHCGLVPGAGAGAGAGGGGATAAANDTPLTSAGKAAGEAGAASAQSAAGSGTADAVRQASGNSLSGSVAGSAAGAFAQNLVGGLFSKKKKPEPAPAGTSAASSAAASSPSEPGSHVVAEFTMETISIDPAPIAADEFEVPAGWTKLTPKPEGEAAMPDCPSASGA